MFINMSFRGKYPRKKDSNSSKYYGKSLLIHELFSSGRRIALKKMDSKIGITRRYQWQRLELQQTDWIGGKEK